MRIKLDLQLRNFIFVSIDSQHFCFDYFILFFFVMTIINSIHVFFSLSANRTGEKLLALVPDNIKLISDFQFYLS